MEIPTFRSLPKISDPLLIDIRRQFERRYLAQFGQSKGRGLYSEDDWARCQYAISLIPEDTKSVLDVGCGPGVLLNYLRMSGSFEPVVGIDKVEYSKFVALIDVDRQIMNATDMLFEDDQFDLVICMEVLEHLEPNAFAKALAELRRVARHHLIVSVPFDEPEPLPTYHKQKFDSAKLQALFPSGAQTIVQKAGNRGCPWVFITERF